MPYCSACQTEKPDEAFGNDNSRASGKAFYCLECHALKVRVWKRLNPDKVRDSAERMRKRRLELKQTEKEWTRLALDDVVEVKL